MFLSKWLEFPSMSCLSGKTKLMTTGISILLKSCASPDMLPPSKEKTCNSAQEQIPFSNDTAESVLRHRVAGWTKDVSTPPRIITVTIIIIYCKSSSSSQIFLKPLDISGDLRPRNCHISSESDVILDSVNNTFKDHLIQKFPNITSYGQIQKGIVQYHV